MRAERRPGLDRPRIFIEEDLFEEENERIMFFYSQDHLDVFIYIYYLS